MSSSSLKLDRLPVEILRRIASISSCEATLALLKVSRFCHRACNDRLVFKAIIDNNNEGKTVTWHGPNLMIGSPTSSWARYALADSKATKLPNDPLIDKFVSWAPQLAALNRKTYAEIKICGLWTYAPRSYGRLPDCGKPVQYFC